MSIILGEQGPLTPEEFEHAKVKLRSWLGENARALDEHKLRYIERCWPEASEAQVEELMEVEPY